MAQKKITDLQLISAITDGVNFPVDNGIQTYRATAAQFKTYVAPVYFPPCRRSILSGSGTFNLTYSFAGNSISATVGATYTNNGVTFTVVGTVASSGYVQMSGSSAPTASGTLTKTGGTGDSTITFTQSRAPLWIKVRGVGGGGGSCGSGTVSGGNGGNGGDTTFGSSLLTAAGGTGATFGSTIPAGGAGTINSPASGQVVTGESGQVGVQGDSVGGTMNATGMRGGASALGGAGSGAHASTVASAGVANTGGGAGGSGANSTAFNNPGISGAGAGYFDAIIPNPSATYPYEVGAGGTAGTAGTNGVAGAAGGTGGLWTEEGYQ